MGLAIDIFGHRPIGFRVHVQEVQDIAGCIMLIRNMIEPFLVEAVSVLEKHRVIERAEALWGVFGRFIG